MPGRPVPARSRRPFLSDRRSEPKKCLPDRFVVLNLDPNSYRLASCTADAMPEMRVAKRSLYRNSSRIPLNHGQRVARVQWGRPAKVARIGIPCDRWRTDRAAPGSAGERDPSAIREATPIRQDLQSPPQPFGTVERKSKNLVEFQTTIQNYIVVISLTTALGIIWIRILGEGGCWRRPTVGAQRHRSRHPLQAERGRGRLDQVPRLPPRWQVAGRGRT